jgi:hypothetical protein
MNIMPEGEAIRKAVKWISEMAKEDPSKRIGSLVQEASLKFDLTPKDAEFLVHFYQKGV